MDHALNWLWQGSFVALVAGVLLAMSRRAPAHARYRIAAFALGSVVLLPLLPVELFSSTAAETSTGAMETSVLVSLPDDWWTSDRLFLGVWAAWTSAAGLRLVTGLAALARARKSCRAFPATVEAQLTAWRTHTPGRAVRLVMSDAVRSAAVLTGRTPFIAVNPAVVDSLEPADLDRIVMHEWAHLERRDDLALFPQLAAHLIAGWHPAAWWLERRLHFEREVACDERVVRLSGSARAYAQCLATLARVSPLRREALPAVGAGPGSNLRQRVQRILALPPTPSWPMRVLMPTAAAVPLVAAIAVADLRVVEAVPLALIAQVTSARPLLDELGEPPEAHVTAAVTPPAREANSIFRPVRAAPSSPSLHVGEVGPQPIATAEVAAVDDDATPGSENPIVPALASAVSWSFSALPAGAIVAPASGVRDGETPPPDSATLWGAAANGGVAVGRGSQKAAVSAAGFFARVGKSIAGSF